MESWCAVKMRIFQEFDQGSMMGAAVVHSVMGARLERTVCVTVRFQIAV